jgi:hypothetical protein
MAFQFAYSLDADASSAIIDFPLDTAVNYKTGAGTNDMKKGDLVFQAAGLLRRAIATTGAGLGVVEGGEFVGLVAAGQPYAAVKSSFTDSATDLAQSPNGIGKVRADKSSCVFRVPVYQSGAVQTATNAHIGVSYTIGLDAAGDQKVDLNTVSTPCVKVVARSSDGKTLFVTLI